MPNFPPIDVGTYGLALTINQIEIGDTTAGTNRSTGYRVGTLSMSRALDNRGTLKLLVRQSHIPFDLQCGHEIGVYDGSGLRIFGGTIDRFKRTRLTWGSAEEYYEITAISWDHRMYRRFITGVSYDAPLTGADAIVDLITNVDRGAGGDLYIGSIDGAVNSVLSDILIYKGVSVGAALDDITRRFDCVWRADAEGAVRVHGRLAVITSIALVNGEHNYRNPAVTEDRSSYANKVTIELSWDAIIPRKAEFVVETDPVISAPRRQFFLSDIVDTDFSASVSTGTPTEFDVTWISGDTFDNSLVGLTFQFGADTRVVEEVLSSTTLRTTTGMGVQNPAPMTGQTPGVSALKFDQIDRIELNGVEQSFGIAKFRPSATFDGRRDMSITDPERYFYWRPGDNVIALSPDAPDLIVEDAPNNVTADKIVVVFHELGGNIVQVQDDAEVAQRAALEVIASGIHEAYISDTGEVSPKLAKDKGERYLTQRVPSRSGFPVGSMPRTFEFDIPSYIPNSHELHPGHVLNLLCDSPLVEGFPPIFITNIEFDDEDTQGGTYAPGDNRAWGWYHVTGVDAFLQLDDALSPFAEPLYQFDESQPPRSNNGKNVVNLGFDGPITPGTDLVPHVESTDFGRITEARATVKVAPTTDIEFDVLVILPDDTSESIFDPGMRLKILAGNTRAAPLRTFAENPFNVDRGYRWQLDIISGDGESPHVEIAYGGMGPTLQ